MYDGILRIEKPDGVNVIEYADDIAIVVVAKTLDEVARNCNATIAVAKSWLQNSGLELAEHKTEALLISSRKRIEQLSIKVGGVDIQSSPQLTYLGVTLDSRLHFKTHLKQSGDKASRVCSTLARLMPNIGGPKDIARVVLASVSKSVMLYAASVWVHATTIKSFSRIMKSAHRLANLRICHAYCTVSDDAAGVLAGRVPIDLEPLLARDSFFMRSRLRMNETQQSLSHTYLEIRDKYLNEWQHRWDHSQKSRWMHSLMPNIKVWIYRGSGVLGFQLTQFLTGHGCFREYLYRFRLASNPYC
ncbi:uncharacterized protein LOC119666070 [Teleopsis dalmanni]|uniref:uncharacterized protein LOC119665744 n=1 Tax=Teleopsis dalmanni TaxID=139649 RepID=UPI0018CF0DD9|nr:uncharacterized protein LOC119665744 [Teleopsis dalmanni]XP_037931272.1 uncharacterized protein LOC119666070 [Teleopsis dalmanni]